MIVNGLPRRLELEQGVIIVVVVEENVQTFLPYYIRISFTDIP